MKIPEKLLKIFEIKENERTYYSWDFCYMLKIGNPNGKYALYEVDETNGDATEIVTSNDENVIIETIENTDIIKP
jgi:hypothetical protein